MKRIDIALAIGIIAAIFISSFTSFARDASEVRHNVVRLHILANSDSDEDQSLKLAVRDKILEQTAHLFKPAASKEEAQRLASESLEEIECAAKAEIARLGYSYPVKAEMVSMFFETRAYDRATLPAGRYDAVRISIGEAKGKNWWCVLFPPLCIPAASEEQPVEEQLKQFGEEPRYIPKLAVLELFEKLSHKKGWYEND